MLPQIKVKTIEHECAHLLHATRGAPDEAEWLAAVELDSERSSLTPRLVDPAQEEDPDVQLIEDWEYFVQYLLADERRCSAEFRRVYPHRAAIVDRALGRSAERRGESA